MEQEYRYDLSGNLQQDDNKGISSVLYNHLNLPVRVSTAQGSIRYVYDAAGIKRQKIVTEGTSTKVTDYLSGMVYEGTTPTATTLQFIPTSEGRALPPEQTGQAFFAYEYHYQDHLGNLRVSLRKQPVDYSNKAF